jgi:hypothetical protein
MTAPSSAATYTIAGRTVTMPCVVRDASAGTAVFEVDRDAARRMVPEPFEPVETAPGRCQLVLAVIDYRDNDLGDYREVGVTFFVTPAGGGPDEAGTYIAHLPVDQEFTCEAGRTIWGFPKTVEDIALDLAPDRATCTLRMDGRLVFRLTLPRGGGDEMPVTPMTTYTLIDGVPHRTAFSQGGSGAQVVPSGDGVALELGDHPLARQLADLGLPAPAQMSTWTERMRGTFAAPEPLAPA